MLRIRLTTSPRRRRPARTTALALIGLVVGMLPFIVPGVLAPKVAHAAPSVQTNFPIFDDLASGAYEGGPATAIVSGPGGDLWLNQARPSVIKLTPSGTTTECVTSGFDGTSWGYSNGYGLAVGTDGNLWATMEKTYVTSSSSSLTAGVIARVTPTCGVTYFPTPTSGSLPYKITSGPSGYLWFTENTANNIGVISTSGAMREFAIPTAASAPTGIVAGPDGNLWFAENSADRIGRMTPTGVFTEFPITAGSHPYDIAVGPDGNLWFTENGASAIGTMTTSGTGYIEHPTPTSGSGPAGITKGPDSAIWFGEQTSTTAVARITAAGSITEYPTNQGYPFGITTGPDGNIWWTSNPVFHSGGSRSGVFRLPLVPCGDLNSSVTSVNNDTGVRDTPGSQESIQISLSNCGVPALASAVTSTAVASPSGCPSAPAIPSFTSTLTYTQSTTHTFSFSEPSCLGTYTVTTTTTMGSTAVASSTTYYVVSNGQGSHIVGDFNGDGYQDVALGDILSGIVAVYYGGPNGLETRAPQVFSETTPGMPSQVPGCPAGTPNSVDAFGQALATGRFEGGGYSDLAIGIPGCGASASSANGGVLVLKGSPAGLTTTGSYFFYAPSSMAGFAEFGRSIVSGDFNHDGYSDVVIAAPLQNVGSIAEEGAVDIMYGSPSGLTGQNVLTENSPGVPGPAATRYDNFGWNMAVGDFNGDGNSDVAINEGENKNGVVVLYGSASGLTFTGAQYLQEVAGSEYSAFLATGQFKGDGYDDLAIGEPYGGTTGLVEVHYGSASGLGTVAYGTSQKITLQSRGMPAEPSRCCDLFGAGLAAGDIKHNGHADLIALGAPGGAIVMWGTSTKLATRGSGFVAGGGGVSITGNIGLGDFNSDGYADELYCVPTADTAIPNPTCNVYKGSATGLSTSPSQTFTLYQFQMSSLQGNHAAW